MAIDVEPTAQVIDQAAARFRQAAVDLEQLAAKMRAKQDLEYAAEAISTAHNAIQNARLDLLVTRPMREYQLAVRKAEAASTAF